MGCRKKTACEIVKKGADYVLAVKSKQPATAGRHSRRLRIRRANAVRHYGALQFRDREQGGMGAQSAADAWATSASSVVGHANDRGERANGATSVHWRHFIGRWARRSGRTGARLRGARGGEHVTAQPSGAESGEGREVEEESGPGLGVSANDTSNRAIRRDCPRLATRAR